MSSFQNNSENNSERKFDMLENQLQFQLDFSCLHPDGDGLDILVALILYISCTCNFI